MIDLNAIENAITAAANEYEHSAPTITEWLNDLYIRLHETPDKIVLTEIYLLARLRTEDGFVQPNVAANDLYKLMNRLGRDTTGQAGF